MHLLIVTPMHNEADNVVGIHGTLSRQTFREFDWVVVDDGSEDGTSEALSKLNDGVTPTVVRRKNDGGLINGSAYTAWRFGVSHGLDASPDRYSHVMKLDADVRLPSDYFARVLAQMGPGVAIAGGVIVGNGMREQAHHVPGPVKLYTAEAYRLLEDLPSAIGFDVMDEVAVSEAGYQTQVVRDAHVALARAIGASEGSVHGRYRNGRVCRWTGYDPLYFLLHALRYTARRPYVIGSLAMIIGYLKASSSPYNLSLRRVHARLQRAKLRQALRGPVKWLRTTYGY